ncbi:MAG: hypothetical protein GYB38_05705 [Gammaproteobacteria bacterium]|nr:hypothetical protein [Gammaproteobacteria bacterium]
MNGDTTGWEIRVASNGQTLAATGIVLTLAITALVITKTKGKDEHLSLAAR